jgi:hypothetical protein
VAWGNRARLALKLIAIGSFGLGGEALAQEPITAVYKAQEISFQYRSSNRFYPCHELERRVAVILLSVGARDDIEVKARNCDGLLIQDDMNVDPATGRDSMDPWERDRDRWGASSSFDRSRNNREQYASVRVRLMMPAQVTPELLKEIDKDKSRRELVSRVTGNPAAAFNDPVVFEAKRQEVTLSQRTIRLRPEDCELLDQMAMSVFRRLDVKVLRRSTSCGPRDSASRIPPQLVAEALLPTGALLPMPDPEKERDSPKPGGSAPGTPEPATETPPQQ